MKEICVKADTDNIDEVYEFIEGELNELGVSRKEVLVLHMIVDEIFSNIAYYAYKGDDGRVWISFHCEEGSDTVAITFKDEGSPFDPLREDEPDVDLPAGERKPGGLGVYMVRNSVDDIRYEYSEGKNILTIIKKTGGNHV